MKSNLTGLMKTCRSPDTRTDDDEGICNCEYFVKMSLNI